MKLPSPVYLTEEKKQEYLLAAQKYEKLSFQDLYDLVASQQVPRSDSVSCPPTVGCLVCGRKILEYGNYPYKFDLLNSRWKITCPSCGTVFPSNDFEAYYRGGLDENGFFKPDRARAHDRSLIAAGGQGNLVNVLYPEKGEKWGVDDGYGYTDPETGFKYLFVAYINHAAWAFITRNMPNIQNAVRDLQHAYQATGDPAWAGRGIVLLDRIADVYPELDIALCPWAQGYLNSHGGGIDKGKAVGSIWETGLVSSFMEAFQVFAEPLLAGRLPDALAFIAGKEHRIRLREESESAQSVYERIMCGIVAEVFPEVMETNIHGNYGMHQSALALAAVLWDRNPGTKEWLDFDFRSSRDCRQRLFGGNISAVMTDLVDRDGYGRESAPGYNSIWLRSNMAIARILDGYELDGDTWDLYRHPKLRRMLHTMYPLLLSDIYTARIGDVGSCGDPVTAANPHILLEGFLHYGEPELAQAAVFVSGNDIGKVDFSGFSLPPEEVRAKVQAVLDTYGPLQLRGTHQAGYGFIALRDGTPGATLADPRTTDQRALYTQYGRNTGHGHLDTLNIGLYAYGLDLTPDMGYPRYADMLDMHRQSVVHNTISHNTVIVDDRPQTFQYSGTPLHYDWGERVKLFDVDAPLAYRDTVSVYRRTGALIRIDARNSYAVDLFRVAGGSSHCYGFHGAETSGVVTQGLSLTAQADAASRFIGTAAGLDTEYPWNADVRDLTGRRYQINVERDSAPAGDFSADYSVLDTWNILGGGAHAPTDIHLKLTLLGHFDEVTLCDMLPPENKVGNPKTLRYVLAGRRGEDLESCFTAVIEPYRGASKIASAKALPVLRDGKPVRDTEARAVRVTLTSGRVDIIVNAVDPAALYTVCDGAESIPFSGFFGLLSRENGQEAYYLNDGARIGSHTCDTPALTGRVVDFTRDISAENTLTVTLDQAPADPASLTGRYVYAETDPDRNAAYEIRGCAANADGTYTLGLGDITLIRRYADAYDFSKGFVYEVAEGRAFRIPLSAEG